MSDNNADTHGQHCSARTKRERSAFDFGVQHQSIDRELQHQALTKSKRKTNRLKSEQNAVREKERIRTQTHRLHAT
jgi:hypothetical protein